MLLWDPLLSPEKYDKLREEIRLLQEKGTPCLYLYERDRVLGRQEMVARLAKAFPAGSGSLLFLPCAAGRGF